MSRYAAGGKTRRSRIFRHLLSAEANVALTRRLCLKLPGNTADLAPRLALIDGELVSKSAGISSRFSCVRSSTDWMI